MSGLETLGKQQLSLKVDDVDLTLDAMWRAGPETPVVFLHGFGSTKEDYADIVRFPAFDGHAVLAYDAPGCGGSDCADLSALSIPFLVKTVLAVLDQFAIDRFHLVGHSMGGLTAHQLARHIPERLVSFTNIEGNLAPEDCFLSRQILQFPADDPDIFFDHFIERIWQSDAPSQRLYAASLRHKVRAQAIKPIFSSMVHLSDNTPLLEQFLALPCPKMVVYGDDNNHLSYLPRLAQEGVRLAEISHSGHFPMYANPVRMWEEMADFIQRAEDKS